MKVSDFFARFSSNTLAGSGNQSYFESANPSVPTLCRTYFRVTHGGEFPLSFLFSNTVDTTFADGSQSRSNYVLRDWHFLHPRIGCVEACGEAFAPDPTSWTPLTVQGEHDYHVQPAEFFVTDPIPFAAETESYICLEFAFAGPQIPCHPESILATFTQQNGVWIRDCQHPFPSMMGIERPNQGRIAFWGDSITQGIGTPINSYAHWNAVAAECLGPNYAYWNLGIGYARALDAASRGTWFYKAQQNDLVIACFGVNDLLHAPDADVRLIQNLTTIRDSLLRAGCRLVLQMIPPFDYDEYACRIWHEVNRFIRTECASVVPVFDPVPLLALSQNEPHRARFGGHPNPEGCRIWGSALAQFLQDNHLLPN